MTAALTTAATTVLVAGLIVLVPAAAMTFALWLTDRITAHRNKETTP